MIDRVMETAERLWVVVRKHRYETAFIASIVATLVVVSIGVAIARPAASTAPVAIAPQSSPSLPVSTASPSVAALTPPSLLPSATPVVASFGASAAPSIVTPDESTETPEPTEQPGVDAYPTPEPDPSVSVQVGGMGGDAGFNLQEGDSIRDVLHLITRDLDRSKCSLTQSYEPDDPSVSPWSKRLRPLSAQTVTLTDGWHTFVASCPSVAGTLKASVRAIAMDRQPEKCKGFEFVRDDISAASYEELTAGVVGTWAGCAGAPGLMYAVVFTLRSDGTYSAKSGEVLDGNEMTALGYGTDPDSPRKIYAINDFQASRLGVGQIDVVFDDGSGSVVRDELRSIRLMGDKLEFDLYHFSQFAVTFQLNRVSSSS